MMYNSVSKQRNNKMSTQEKLIKALEHNMAAVSGAYYRINLTKNLVPGTMYQVIDEKEYRVYCQPDL